MESEDAAGSAVAGLGRRPLVDVERRDHSRAATLDPRRRRAPSSAVPGGGDGRPAAAAGRGAYGALETFIDGKSHPELFPIWLVFDSFSGDIRLAKHYDPTESLIEFGPPGKTLETIIRFATGYWNERQVRVRDNLQRLEVALEFARLVDERMGPRAFEAAVRAGDTGALAEASGYSVELVEEFFATWRRRPAEEFAIQMLPRLKAILGPISWKRFRAYLLEVKAPFLVSITAEVDDETWVRRAAGTVY